MASFVTHHGHGVIEPGTEGVPVRIALSGSGRGCLTLLEELDDGVGALVHEHLADLVLHVFGLPMAHLADLIVDRGVYTMRMHVVVTRASRPLAIVADDGALAQVVAALVLAANAHIDLVAQGAVALSRARLTSEETIASALRAGGVLHRTRRIHLEVRPTVAALDVETVHGLSLGSHRRPGRISSGGSGALRRW